MIPCWLLKTALAGTLQHYLFNHKVPESTYYILFLICRSLLSEYLGTEAMLAVVCKTYKGVKALETYDNQGCIDESTGLQGLGASIGRPLNGRFLVICLENLRYGSILWPFAFT